MRHQFEDNPNEFDSVDSQNRSGRSGRIILLGDGTEVLTDMNDDDMFDHTDEDEDLDSQVRKGSTEPSDQSARGEREGTPAPQSDRRATSQADTETTTEEEKSESPRVISASPASTTSEPSSSSTSAEKPPAS